MLNPTHLLAVVFDLDDTLYPEEQYVRSGFHAIDVYLASRGECLKGRFCSMASSLFEGGLRGRIFDEALRRLDIEPNDSKIQSLVEVYRSHFPTIALFPDAESCLGSLSRRYQFGIITDGFGISQRQKIKALGLERWTQHIVYSDDFGRDCWKPHSRPFIAMQHRLGMEPQALVYIGDNPSKDFVGARRAGWSSVRIRRPGTLHRQVEPTEVEAPDFELRSLTELARELA